MNAAVATVFWDPDGGPNILHILALPIPSSRYGKPFCLADIRCPIFVLLTPDGSQHLLVQDSGRGLQLVVAGANLLENVRLMTDAVIASPNQKAHLRSLECFNDLCRSGKLLPRHFPKEARGSRLRTVLQALDGRLAGASHREIAMALFGAARVEADWADPRGHMRDRVRRAVHRGQGLMNGGYRRFLS